MIHSVAYGSASKRANQKITDISDLIYDSYKKYNSLSASTIEKLRFKHRIKVVQNLEENAIKNVVRSVQSNSFVNFHLNSEEIHEFYTLIKECILRQQFYGQQIKGLNLNDNTNEATPLYENVKIDFETFKSFFSAMSSWSNANNMERLALRVFKFADENNDNLINFLEFLILIVLLTKSDIDSRLKLFFCMHQIPLPKDSQLYLEEDSQDQSETKNNLLASSKVVLEIGTEANEDLNFFEINDEVATFADTNESIVNYSEFEHCSNMSSTSSAELVTYDYPKTSIYEILPPSLAKSASPGQSPMQFFIRQTDNKEDKNELFENKKLPILNLTQFYQLWSTLYDLFDNEEQRLGHIIKKFGLNLLEIAETAAKEINFETVVRDSVDLNIIKQQPKTDLKSEQKSELLTDSNNPSSSLDAASTDSFEIVNNSSLNEQRQLNQLINELDVQHAISIYYSHFKASLLIEEELSNFFEKTYEIDELFIKFRNNQLNDRTTSLSSKD